MGFHSVKTTCTFIALRIFQWWFAKVPGISMAWQMNVFVSSQVCNFVFEREPITFQFQTWNAFKITRCDIMTIRQWNLNREIKHEITLVLLVRPKL
jgi:hypothetical protein